MPEIHDPEPKDLYPSFPINGMKDIILSSLKGFYANHKEFPWSSDQKKSAIAISDSYPIDRENHDRYPLIVIKRNPFQFRNRHLNQSLYNNLSDRQSKMDILYGTLDVLCTSTVGLEADRIAEEVFLFLCFYRDQISMKGIFDIRSLVLGEESIQRAGSDTDTVTVPVRAVIEVPYSWEVLEFGSTLEDILVRVRE